MFKRLVSTPIVLIFASAVVIALAYILRKSRRLVMNRPA